MSNEIGAKVESAKINKGIDIHQGTLMFPSYDPHNFGKHVVVNQDGKCAREVVLTFLVNFAVIASDSGDTKKFLDLAGSLIDMSKAGPSALTVINVVGRAIDTIDDALNRKDSKGHQEFHFPVELCCHQKYQPFRVEMEVNTRWLITDKSSDTDFARLDMHLRAHTAADDKKFDLTGKKGGGTATSHKEVLKCEFVTDTDFEVVAWFNEHCKVSWAPGDPSISMIRFEPLIIKITTTAECKEGTIPPFKINPQNPESRTPRPDRPTEDFTKQE